MKEAIPYIVGFVIFACLINLIITSDTNSYALEKPVITTTRNFDNETGVVCYTVTMITSNQFDVSNSCLRLTNTPDLENYASKKSKGDS